MYMIEYPEYRRQLAPRLAGTNPCLFAGRIDHEPPLEVIADLTDGSELVIFHAMLLRRSQAIEAQIDEHCPDMFAAIVDYQRA